MACTTILVGKKASYDGSTMIARNDDSPSGAYMPKKFVVIHPEDQPKVYESVISHVKIELPENPMRYTAMPNAVKGEGIWAASGVNEAQVGMTATETITSNPRVLGADPLVTYQPKSDDQEEIAGGIGEEDIVYIVLPYIHSAREGVQRLGSILEKYGTYEMNGIAFEDVNEIWWLETIGGHHWIARKVPDEVYVVMPNQLGMDEFDLEDALGEQKKQGIDLLSASGHKIHGPKGTGFLYIDEKVKIKPIIYGGGQQKGMRSGTENVPGCAGLGLAAKMVYTDHDAKIDKLYAIKDRMVKGLQAMDGVTVHGLTGRDSAPQIVAAGFEGVRAEVLLHALEDKGIYVSSGSACSSNHPGVSGTLKGIGVKDSLLDSTLRFSFGAFNTEEEVDYCLEVLNELVPMLRRYRRA